MDSLNVLPSKSLPQKVRLRSFWLIALLATILPGGGHLLLGRMRSGLILLGAALALLIPMTAASLMQWNHLQWLGLRAMTGIYLFGVVDAVLLRFELADERDGSGPRGAALANLLLYGLGYGLLGSWPLAAAGGVGGLLLHGFLGARHPIWLVAGELLAIALALHALQAGKESNPQGRTVGGKDRTPSWIWPSLGSFIGLHLFLVIFSYYAGNQLQAALQVDQSGAVSAEPYYRNAHYGVRVELDAPGWSFVEAASDEYVRARHVSGDAEFSLRSAPRVLGFPDPTTMARTVLGEGLLEGISLSIVDEGPTRFAGLDGWRIRATGHQGPQRREVQIVAAGKGWRNYVLWYEWGEENHAFAAAELSYLLGHLDLAGSMPPADAMLAR